MSKRLDTVIIGGGQAGLSTSYYLSQQGRQHVILEKNRIGEAWRSQKWDSFTLVTPNWQIQLPGFEYEGDDPDGFLARDEIVQYLEAYVDLFNPPARLGVEATSVEPLDAADGYTLETDAGTLEARNVVVATGTFQSPRIPTFSQAVSPGVVQLHSSRYRNPEQLPPGSVLVVGSGQSGCQITEELNESGRGVYLCTSGVARAPRRYRGKDFTWWLVENGFVDRTMDDLPSPAARFNPNPHVTGKDGGHTLNLHQFAKDGVTLLGHMEDASGWQARLADDLMDNLKQADEAAAKMKQGIDTFIEKAGIDAAKDDQPTLKAGYDAEVITELDLDNAGIRTIIWATGYTWDYSWVSGLNVDKFGYPVQERGVTQQKGLYFVGLHWLHTLKSGLLLGVGDDAAHVASEIDSRT